MSDKSEQACNIDIHTQLARDLVPASKDGLLNNESHHHINPDLSATMPTTHTPHPSDTTLLLLNGLGYFILFLATITLLDPGNLFSIALPLGCFGVVLLLLPWSGKVRRIMEGGESVRPFLVHSHV
ncbi:hypothetical protein TI39_contig389g00004 [Zymoseptoria brevis]|uniref:Uncharacterized protein n=1 Tax=Zymoseptoria brevis TaxID=1047168 RepID=A0A0F4GMZ8_9PEZI|nr:hypothetical protein TI39_contig389g00004 [Zymoseptoria brevis]